MSIATAPTPLDRGDVRTGGRWSGWQRFKNAAIYRVISGVVWLLDRLPENWLLLAGRAAGRASAFLLTSERRHAEARLAAAGYAPPHARQLACRCFVNAGSNLALSLCLRRPATRALDRIRIEESGERVLERALAAGTGVVFVSAHLGPFEWIAAAIAETGARPAIVVRESYDPRLDAIVDRHRLARGIEIIHRGGKGAALRIARALRQGRPVGFLPDLGGRVPSRPARFLGRAVHFPLGPQRIAIRLGVPIVVGTLCDPVAGRWRLAIEPVATQGTEAELTQRVADALSAAIRRCPGHWPWMAQV